MPETVIELDLSDPWEPPEPPAPRARLRTRWVAVCAVLAVVLGMLVAATPRPRTGPLLRIGGQVRGVTVAGDMLFVDRYQQAASDLRVEGRRRSDGKVLWTLPIGPQQHSVTVAAGALILSQYTSDDTGFTAIVTAVDALTGRPLWTKQGISLYGARDGLIVAEEIIPSPRTVVVAGGEQPDFSINHADETPRHIMVLDVRSGATVWDVTASSGTVLDLAWEGRYPTGRLAAVDQLDPSGVVTRRDVRTGAVKSSVRLAWSGRPAVLRTGAAWQVDPGRVPGRAVVYPDGERGGIVFDLADGRALFRTGESAFEGLYRCSAALFCAATERGLETYDSTTGESRWQLDRYTQVIAAAGDRLVVSTALQDGPTAGKLGVVDARTGALTTDLAEWRLMEYLSGDRLLVWRPAGERTAIVGELDPATGRVAVFARPSDWYGAPECSADGDTLGCVMVGELTIWHLPPRR